MVRPPSVSGEQAVRALNRLGFKVVRQRGSHVILRKETKQGAIGCAVPMHKELALGTLRGILKQAQVDLEDFVEHL